MSRTAGKLQPNQQMQKTQSKRGGTVLTVPPNPYIVATARCGDNDNDPQGYDEYSVGAVAGGQFSWGWDINSNLYCKDVTLSLRLVSSGTDTGIRFRPGTAFDLVDDTTPWGEINACWIQVSVASTSKYGVRLEVTGYNGNSSSATATAGLPIAVKAPAKAPRKDVGPLSVDALVFENESFTDLDISAKISMYGIAPISRNGVVGKILLYGTTLEGVQETKTIVPETFPPNCRVDWNRSYLHK
jgi:hypothetical protein